MPSTTGPDAPAAPPLAAYQTFATRDLDEAREKVARIFCPHRLDSIGGHAGFSARQHHLKGERLSLNYIDYGSKTLIAPGELERFYLLQIPLAGAAMIANGPDRYATVPGQASVLNPHLPTMMIWGEGCSQLLVQIDRQAMQDHLAQAIGGRADRPLTFTGALDLTRGPGEALGNLVRHLVAEADAGRAPIGQGGLLARSIESAILTGLIEAHSHNYQRLLGRSGASAAVPRQVRLAEEFIMAHLSDPLTIEAVAAVAGVTPRALQIAFRSFRGTTPLAFWREERLGRAHRDLTAAAPGLTVTDVALRWGFQHFGRFAALYAARFGQSPSLTLRRARGADFLD